MFDQQLSCAACGEKLNPTAGTCPRCGALRSVAVVNDAPEMNTHQSEDEQAPQTQAAQASDATATKTELNGSVTKNNQAAPVIPAFYIAPADEKRRSFQFNTGLLKPIGIGLAILLIVGISIFSYWRYARNREMQELVALQQAYERQQKLQQSNVVLPDAPLPLPTPAPVDDQTLTATVRAALSNYDIMAAATKYKFEIKEGVVMLSGQADNQAEKDGVENVVKGVNGVKAVINTMTVKNAGDQISVVQSPKLSEAEAKRLEEVLSKEQAENQRRAEEERRKQVLLDDQRKAEQEADKLRREQAAAKIREEESALRRQAEERLRQEAEDYERRQEEMRRAEADRRARAEQARLQASTLRTGTVAWSGLVNGVEDIVISGSSASVRHVSGELVREPRASFSASVPRAPVTVKLLSSGGRVPVKIVQEPSSANGYTTIVRVGDGEKGGKRSEFTLKWSMQ